jgi:hypothetical protein
VTRFTLTVVVLTALFSSAVRLPAAVCVVASTPIGKACHQGCCANKVCCVDSEKNKSLPSTPAVKDTGANQQPVAIPLANSLDVFAQLPVVESVDPAGKKTIICAQPQLAVLCSFLI